ncbi:tyrosine-type recombinase/integrase [Nocardia sp. NPDC050435]|uniref:tyrosine-type recombinase/integrase n=1 Tax=Nocardia sp. NPDC050435 TaxID=3155040 RepID=UPI0033F52B3B
MDFQSTPPTTAPYDNQPTPELLSVDQVWALLKSTNRQVACMMLVSAQANLRPSEVAGFRVRDIDFDRCEIHVRQQASPFPGQPPTARLKTRTSRRIVPLPKEAFRALRAHLDLVERENQNELISNHGE